MSTESVQFVLQKVAASFLQVFCTKRVALCRKCFIFVSMSSSNRVTSVDFRQIAEQIRLIADGYDQLAKTMEKAGVSDFEASGIDTLKRVTIGRLDGTLERNRSRFMKLHRARLAASLSDKIQTASSLPAPTSDDSDHEESPGRPITSRATGKPKKAKQPPAKTKEVGANDSAEGQEKPRHRKSG